MSSRITTIYDGIITHLSTIFPVAPDPAGYFRLRNPYKVEQNPESMLIKGWGFSLGPAENTEIYMDCNFGITRQLNVMLTRQWIALENDVLRRADVEKAVLEDQFLLFQSLEGDNTIGQVATDVKYVSDNGIEFVEVDNNKFLMVNSLLQLKYFEKITP